VRTGPPLTPFTPFTPFTPNPPNQTLKEAKKEHKAASKDESSVAKDHADASKGVAKLTKQLDAMAGSFNAEQEQSLMQSKAEAEEVVSTLRPKVDRLTAELEGRLAFEYRKPNAQFDKSKVKGLVAKLVSVADPSTATALEVVAGGKLFQVVVDDEQTAKLLLQKGQLKKRVTIIPLSKISRNGLIDQRRASAAAAAAAEVGGTARRAIELVGYDDEVRAAMEYTFGDKLICDTMEAAQVRPRDGVGVGGGWGASVRAGVGARLGTRAVVNDVVSISHITHHTTPHYTTPHHTTPHLAVS
jgi:structural maintenance of chromosome 2